jgi:hypothetical protein
MCLLSSVCFAILEYFASTLRHYSIFTSGVYKATALDAAFPQEKPHFPEPDCAE